MTGVEARPGESHIEMSLGDQRTSVQKGHCIDTVNFNMFVSGWKGRDFLLLIFMVRKGIIATRADKAREE